MNKLAAFVEGRTEALFIKKLIEEIAGKNNVEIEQQRIIGGSNIRRSIQIVEAAKPNTGQKYYVLIMDCGDDSAVKSRIIEEHENLTKSGYSKIIGMRDLRPDFTILDIAKLEMNLPKYIKTSLCPVVFVLSVMEIEAWFLAEVKHFHTIHPAITVAAIKSKLGFDPENDDLEQ